jgi:GH24 family phage-related lysozyme (muramidase)
MASDFAQQLIEESEGRRAKAYRDSRGYLSIGVGCCIDDRIACDGLCNEAIDAQFAHDSSDARAWAAAIPGFSRLNQIQQAVLVSMCFQLGSLHNWPNFKAAIAIGDMNTAYLAGKASLWYSESPQRAERELMMLKTGTWIQSA